MFFSLFLTIGWATTFPLDPEYKRNVDFWVQVYSQLSSNQGLIHDAQYLDRIYERLDLTNLTPQEGRRLLSERRQYWREILLSTHEKKSDVSSLLQDEAHVFNILKDINDSDRFLKAAQPKRIRYQVGQKESFLMGMIYASKYLPEMEKTFTDFGLPSQLTHIPFVESSFQVLSISKAGAQGIWQFISSTALRYLLINDIVDERKDPYRSTIAAAKLFQENYRALGSWPLAITAYNHGRAGVAKLLRETGSVDFFELIKNVRSRRFGFASRNYYFEFLAANEVYTNRSVYFGKFTPQYYPRFTTIALADYLLPNDFFQAFSIPAAKFFELNPGFSSEIRSGRKRLPPQYAIRVPLPDKMNGQKWKAQFIKGYSVLPKRLKHHTQIP